jgi:DNA-binding transcriptional LysR family regulator
VLRARDAVGGVDELFHRNDRRLASTHAGVVRIAAPTFIGRRLVLDRLAEVTAQNPGLVIDMRLSEALADVVDQQIDVGVRIGMLRDSRFVARPVAKVDFIVVGAPSLLARVGRPSSLEALFAQPITGLVDRNTGRLWPWLFKSGRQMAPAAPTFVTDHAEAECEAVLAGLGFGQLPSFFAEPHIRAGRLVPLFEEEAPDPWTLYVYRSQRTPVPARVRLVFDVLLEAMAKLTPGV